VLRKGEVMGEENKTYPFRVKYKGYTITQIYGEVIISDRNRREVLTIHTKKPKHTMQELCDLFDFNETLIRGC
jgi:hypothetical protein